MIILLVLLLCVKAEIYPILNYDLPQLYIKDANIVDENNTRIVLQGLNFDYSKITIQHIQYFKLNGLNTIRFTSDIFDNKLLWAIQQCIDYGLYVILNCNYCNDLYQIQTYDRRILINTDYILYILSDNKPILGPSIIHRINITELEDSFGYMRELYPIIIVNFGFKMDKSIDFEYIRDLSIWLNMKDINNIILNGVQYDNYLRLYNK
jgi:hypothetical protein